MKTEIRCKVELREDATLASPGRVTGTLLRYGDPGQQGREVFLTGALSWPEEGVVLNEQHNRQAPIVRFVPTVEGNEVRVDVDLPDTQRGRDAATSVRNGTLRGLSVEFHAIKARMVNGVRRISEAALVTGGLVDDPSYSGSTVEVRGAGQTETWLRPWG